MSDHIYEERQFALWAEYRDLNGRVSFDAFMERHPRVNAYVVNLLNKFGTVSAEIDCPVSRSDYFGANSPLSEDDFADSYANPKGGI